MLSSARRLNANLVSLKFIENLWTQACPKGIQRNQRLNRQQPLGRCRTVKQPLSLVHPSRGLVHQQQT